MLECRPNQYSLADHPPVVGTCCLQGRYTHLVKQLAHHGHCSQTPLPAWKWPSDTSNRKQGCPVGKLPCCRGRYELTMIPEGLECGKHLVRLLPTAQHDAGLGKARSTVLGQLQR